MSRSLTSLGSTDTPAGDAEREQLRTERKLRLVKDSEVGDSLQAVPAGVYGFSSSPHTEGTPLFPKRGFQAFEVHKLADGSVEYIGYMKEADAQALAGSTEVELKLYPQPFTEATVFVSVAREGMLRAKPLSRENGNYLAFLWHGE